AGLGVSREVFDDVLAGQQGEAGLILDGVGGELAGITIAQLDVQFVAQVLNGVAEVVFNLADKINQRLAGSTAPSQSQFASGNLDGHRDEVFGAVELEVV